MRKIFYFTFLLIGIGLIYISCYKWDNPYDSDNDIQLSLTMQDTIRNETLCTIQWKVETKKGKPAKKFRNFDLKISLFRDNVFLEEIAQCQSNDKSFIWHVDVLKPHHFYKIQINSTENFEIQAFSNQFIITE